MSLMTVNSASAEDLTIREYSRCSEVRSVSNTRSVMPMTPFIGVRISWLILARNSLLDRFAASATSLAARRPCSLVRKACSVSHRAVASRLTIQPADPQDDNGPDNAQREDNRNPLVVAIGEQLTLDEQPLLLVVDDVEQSLNVFHETQGFAARHPVGCHTKPLVVAQANDFIGEFNLPTYELCQRRHAALLLGVVHRQRADGRQRDRRLRNPFSVRREESVVADEDETAIADLDVLHRRPQFGDPLQDVVRVPD